MSKFKVGDWVKAPNWDDYYEVVDVDIDAGIICVRCDDVSYCHSVYVKYSIKKEETMKLEVGGKYRMVGTHEPVRVICTDRKNKHANEFTYVSLVDNGEVEYVVVTTEEGKNPSGQTLFEEVSEVNWSNVPIDTPIWVAEKNYSKDYQTTTVLIKRHFAEYSPITGRVYFYYGGATSHTTDQPVQSEIAANCYLENPEV